MLWFLFCHTFEKVVLWGFNQIIHFKEESKRYFYFDVKFICYEQNYVRHKAGKCEKDHFCIGRSFSFAIALQLDKLVAVFFPLGTKKEAETRYKEFSLWKQFHLERLSLLLLSQDFSFHIHSGIFVPKIKKKKVLWLVW